MIEIPDKCYVLLGWSRHGTLHHGNWPIFPLKTSLFFSSLFFLLLALQSNRFAFVCDQPIQEHSRPGKRVWVELEGNYLGHLEACWSQSPLKGFKIKMYDVSSVNSHSTITFATSWMKRQDEYVTIEYFITVCWWKHYVQPQCVLNDFAWIFLAYKNVLTLLQLFTLLYRA